MLYYNILMVFYFILDNTNYTEAYFTDHCYVYSEALLSKKLCCLLRRAPQSCLDSPVGGREGREGGGGRGGYLSGSVLARILVL